MTWSQEVVNRIDVLLDDAHGYGLRLVIDLVPNHTSSQHAGFREALAAGPGSAARRRYHFRAGTGRGGRRPPNNWRSAFGGPAWTRVTAAEGAAAELYLHLHHPGQPDLNWDNPVVGDEFESILRFWLDRDVDGIRIDVAMCMAKDPRLPDLRRGDHLHPYRDRPGVRVVIAENSTPTNRSRSEDRQPRPTRSHSSAGASTARYRRSSA